MGEVIRSKSDAATLWVTYDTSDGEYHPTLDGFRVEAHAPVIVRVLLDDEPWAKQYLEAGEEWSRGATGIEVDRFRFEIGG